MSLTCPEDTPDQRAADVYVNHVSAFSALPRGVGQSQPFKPAITGHQRRPCPVWSEVTPQQGGRADPKSGYSKAAAAAEAPDGMQADQKASKSKKAAATGKHQCPCLQNEGYMAEREGSCKPMAD